MNRNLSRLARFSFAALAAALLIAPARAQQQEEKGESVSKVVRKGKAPVSKEVLRVKLPRAVERKLSNGATVLVLEDHRFPSVFVSLSIPGAGGLFDPADSPGLASFAAQMLREGTKTRTSRQIAEEVARLGANISSSASFGSDDADLGAQGLSDNFDDWCPVLVDVLLNPSFPKDELDRLRARAKVGLRQQRTTPGFLVNERFSRAVYGGHPAAVVSPTEASLDSLTSEKLAEWHRQRYVPQNAVLGIAGDVRVDEVVAKLEKWLAGWKKTDFVAALPQGPSPAGKKQIYLVDRPNSVQTTLWLGNIAIDRTSPDFFAMTVMNRVVGGGAAARLFLNLREEKSYTYGAYSAFSAGKYAGPWRAWADVRTEVTEGAMTEFFNEIRRIREEKVPDAELTEAKNAMVANFALSLEQPNTLLNLTITRQVYGLPADYWDTYPAKLQAVTADDIQRVARKYLNLEALQVAAVGDAKKIREVLEKFGPVEVYDTEGKKAEQKAAGSN